MQKDFYILLSNIHKMKTSKKSLIFLLIGLFVFIFFVSAAGTTLRGNNLDFNNGTITGLQDLNLTRNLIALGNLTSNNII